MTLEQQLLLRAQQLSIVKQGNFTLSSGQKSSIYIDVRLLGLDGLGTTLIGQIISQRLSEKIKSIGGMATGSISLTTSSLIAICQKRKDIQGFYIRKESKQHGRLKMHEGYLVSPAVVIDDVATTGQSLLKVASYLKEHKIKVALIMSIVDRGIKDIVETQGYNYDAILSLKNNQLDIYPSDSLK